MARGARRGPLSGANPTRAPFPFVHQTVASFTPIVVNTHIGFHSPFLRNEIPVFTGNLEQNRQTITIKMTFIVLPVNPVSNTSHKQFSKYRPSPLLIEIKNARATRLCSIENRM
ncbi:MULTISPECIES: hypothetical protein [Burkholderia cepacia complex]|uniref:hypothetical protein n=1 Tax=Burkholderia cepacia complex TaxID=87882 RepID=UPI000F5AF22B|nr:hypothetical protein [Burkholderia cenocepacia]MBR8507083.1 hypothetical protein [Burkholderia cenocepacia]